MLTLWDLIKPAVAPVAKSARDLFRGITPTTAPATAPAKPSIAPAAKPSQPRGRRPVLASAAPAPAVDQPLIRSKRRSELATKPRRGDSDVGMQAKYDARNPAALKRLVAGGTKLFRFPKEMMEAAFKEALALYSEIGATNPAWKKIYEDYATFRRDSNLWFRFTEAGFDDFMQAQRL